MSPTDLNDDFEIFTTFRFDPRFAPLEYSQNCIDISMLYMPRHHYDRLRASAEHFGFSTSSNVLQDFDQFSEYVLDAIRRRGREKGPTEVTPSALRVRRG